VVGHTSGTTQMSKVTYSAHVTYSAKNCNKPVLGGCIKFILGG